MQIACEMIMLNDFNSREIKPALRDSFILLRTASKQSYPFYPAENYYKFKGMLA